MALLARHAPGSAACAQQMRAPTFGMAWLHATAAAPREPAARAALQLRRQAGREPGARLCACAPRLQPQAFARRRLVRVCAGWGAEPEWQPCRVADSRKAAEGLVQLRLDIGELAGGYTKPGQCVQVQPALLHAVPRHAVTAAAGERAGVLHTLHMLKRAPACDARR